MDRDPLTASGRLMVAKALARISVHPSKSGCILLLNRQRLVGIATLHDFMTLIAQENNWQQKRLADIVTRPVITVSLADLKADRHIGDYLLERFAAHQIRQLPVVNERNHLLGLIHENRVLRLNHSYVKKKAHSKAHSAVINGDSLTPDDELRRQHQRSQLLAEITLKIRQSLQLKTILQTTVDEVQRLLDTDRVLIYQVLPDGTGKPISEAVVPPYPKILGYSFPEEVFPEEYQILYAKGRIQAIADVHAPDAGIAECLVEFIEQWGIQAKLIVPILQPLKTELSIGNAPIRNHLWGLLIAHQCRSTRQWSEFELELMQQLADQISIALSHGQMLEFLEERVRLRTLELTQANQKLNKEIHERKQTEVALRRSEEQLRLITNNLPVLIAYVDHKQRYRFNNQAYEFWLGRSPADIHNKSMKAIMGTAHYKTIKPYIESTLAGNQVTYESELTLNDGRSHSVTVSYIPHVESSRNGSSKVSGFFALTTDISDRKAIERMKDEFIAVVSHELRTPLTSIHGSLKLMATGRLGQLSAEGQQMLEVADENTDRLVRLVNNVLDLQRIESGEVTMDAHACDVSTVIEKATDAMLAIAQQHAIEITLQPLSEPLCIWADPDYIVQTLTNLINNAIKFSAPGNVIELSVCPHRNPGPSTTPLPLPADTTVISCFAQSAMALFCVQDQGQGIPADKLNSIFERFQQVDSSDSRKKGGTGLGLTICRKIIEQHGGNIWAESQKGVGSRFYFTVPLCPDEAT
ncbi:MAG: ATP-binding protein [Cyanobacteria bacterium J06633_2]